MAEPAGFCSVSDNDCLNPAGYRVGGSGIAHNSDGPRTRARCYECGEPCCAKCRTGKRGHWHCVYCADREEWRKRTAFEAEIAGIKAAIYSVRAPERRRRRLRSVN